MILVQNNAFHCDDFLFKFYYNHKRNHFGTCSFGVNPSWTRTRFSLQASPFSNVMAICSSTPHFCCLFHVSSLISYPLFSSIV
uniref:Uncharacterized protein n=1 Tax=Rhizophora mucronata TaxID=61149 RepID=A0A2P2N866_RHIMU